AQCRVGARARRRRIPARRRRRGRAEAGGRRPSVVPARSRPHPRAARPAAEEGRAALARARSRRNPGHPLDSNRTIDRRSEVNVKRYFARTAREAMALVRAELGEDAVVLKNRPVDGGVEILALAGAELEASADERSGAASTRSAPPPASAATMSTVHFENYVRERQQRRLAEEQAQRAEQPLERMPAGDFAPLGSSSDVFAPSGSSATFAPAPAVPAWEAAMPAAQAHDAERLPESRSDRIDTQALMAELREMRGALSDQLESLSWFEGVRRRPGQSRMLRRLLQAGFSPSLSRTLANHLPADFG